MSDTTAVSSFRILYDNENAVYRAGDRLTGKLTITLKDAITLRAVKLQFKGRSCWLGDSKKEGEVEKVYFNRDIVLLDRPPGKLPGHFQWEAGEHVLPFECPLPGNCETSYEGYQAFVRYFCRATIVEAISEEITVTKAPFTVLGASAPVGEAELMRPAAASECVTLSGCCCTSGKLVGEMSLQKSYFLPGEIVIGSLKLENEQPRHSIDGAACRLVERLHRGGSPPIERLIMERRVDKSELSGRGKVNRENVPFLKVPPLASSIAGGKGALVSAPLNPRGDGVANGILTKPSEPLFSLTYALEMKCGPKLTLSLPITIGTAPISSDGGPVDLEEFALGPQNVKESDDGEKFAQGLEYAPLYPVYSEKMSKETRQTVQA